MFEPELVKWLPLTDSILVNNYNSTFLYSAPIISGRTFHTAITAIKAPRHPRTFQSTAVEFGHPPHYLRHFVFRYSSLGPLIEVCLDALIVFCDT